MKHNCYTCIKSSDVLAPFRCPYVSEEIYDAMQHHGCVYPNENDCPLWSISISKVVKYISSIVIDIVAPIMITIICLTGIVAIVCLMLVSKMTIGV